MGLVLMIAAVPAQAQKKDKNKNKNVPASTSGDDIKSAMHMPDAQAVDQTIGEFLGYWQIGDTESLHKYYSNDAVTVSGAWEPPIFGWVDFLKAYQAQRAQVSGSHLDRSNTLIKVSGDVAWATYQFVYVAQAEGKMIQYRGHTTLFLVKQGDRWLITLNHTSIVDSSFPESAAPTDSAQPANR